MLTILILTCPLCGLRYSNRPLLELHIREDHRPRRRAQPGTRDAGSNQVHGTRTDRAGGFDGLKRGCSPRPCLAAGATCGGLLAAAGERSVGLRPPQLTASARPPSSVLVAIENQRVV